ncbi:MAG: hypothetical protein QM305_07495 [Bacteroidota bacterium]|jgi:hypothetical protein|nr:hypothetical protein [Bacteroidota bacterium]
MKTKGKTLNEKPLEQAQAGKTVVLYCAPQLEIIDIELRQNLFGSAELPDVGDGGDAW